MPSVPTAIPDGPKIRELIRSSGWSVAGFARSLRAPQRSVGTVYHIVYASRRTSTDMLRQMAAKLDVTYQELCASDTGDEDEQPGEVAA